ncbi:MAG: FUSC family protein [Streptosporangiaceae bacterium]
MTLSPAQIRTRAAAIRAVVVPDWLAEVVRPRPVAPPWPEMLRAVLAICVPLAVALALGKGTLGVLPAIGGLLSTMADTGGPYLSRVKRVGSATVFGGAIGLVIGSVTHGHGWLALVALVVVAGVSGVLSSVGDIGSITGLQLLVYTALGAGPVGALRPVWHTAAGFLVGVIWALILIVPGWLASPHGKEQRDVAAVYEALAQELRSVGTAASFTSRRQALTAALNTAYDELLTARSTAIGRNGRIARLVAVLNASHLMAEAATALGVAGTPPPPMVIDTVTRLAGAIRDGTPPPIIPPPWDSGPAMLTLRDAMAGAARALAQDWSPEHHTRTGLRDRLHGGLAEAAVQAGTVAAGAAVGAAVGAVGAAVGARRRIRGLAERLLEEFGGGTLNRIFTLRLMICMGVAALVSEVLPLQRSYWVPLTVAIVLKPDYGSVFARALQRGIGTIVGAVAGAVLLVLVHGTWLLIPFAVLAALLPYGRSRNYGLLATFLTPLVVVLIDLLTPAGWRLAEDRLFDTLIGCAIALLVGFAPWPMSWYAHLPRQFGQTALDVCRYMEEALLVPDPSGGEGGSSGGEGASGGEEGGEEGGAGGGMRPPARSRMRRATYRALADLRTEFQRTMSEPPSISRRATAWWPAVVGLEQVTDAITSVALAVSRGAPVTADGVSMLSAALRAVSEAAATGTAVPAPSGLPEDETLKPVTEAVRALLGVLGSGQRLTIRD